VDLKRQLLDTIQNSLIRESVSGCGNWAEKYRVMGEPYPGLWSFKWHPWLREMHDAEGELKVGQKAAQLGYTELGLNKTFYCMDILKLNTLYILPAKTPDATDFSASRFDPSLELSPYLQALFSDVKNTGHKRAGAVNLYIRGSRSRSGLKSIPVSLLILDEVDEMTQDNIPLATERQSGQTHKETWMLSTPTIDDFGINNYFQQSTQEEFFFICPHCSRHINLDFPESLDIEGDDPLFAKGFLKCKECDHRLDHEAKSEWLKDAYWEKKNKTHKQIWVNTSVTGFVKKPVWVRK